MNLIKIIRYDYIANKKNIKSIIFLFFFRCSFYIRNSNIIIRILFIGIRLFYKFILQWGFGNEFPDNLQVGTSLTIHHNIGIVINSNTIIKDNVTLRHNITIGNKVNGGMSPIIGNNVEIGSNSVLIGKIEIGNYAIIGAGSVVTKDVPENAVVAGNPSKIIKYIKQ